MPHYKKLLLSLGLLVLSAVQGAYAGNTERYYQELWCTPDIGRVEVPWPVGDSIKRIDCLTPDFAIEFDFAYKWYEAVTQALYYSELTTLRPAIVLIMRRGNKSDAAKWKAMNDLILKFHMPINTYKMYTDETAATLRHYLQGQPNESN